MTRQKLEPLTYLEQKYAEENHNLVYGFLHRYKYSIEEYYNIVIFGYLKAVQIYTRRKDLQSKYDFAFIAWQYMRSEIGHHFESERTQKRTLPEKSFSLNTEIKREDGTIETCDVADGKSAEDDVMEKMLIANIMEKLSEIQRKITQLKIDGFSNKEVYLLMDIKPSTYYKEMGRIKVIVENILVG